MLKHDQTRWRFDELKHHVRENVIQWVFESDDYKCMAVMELDGFSKWYTDRHPDWETEYNENLERIRANANLIQSAPIMLEALLAAKAGDNSLIEKAIEHATGIRDWRGELNETIQ